MSVPGVGALVAITFTSAVDDPARFRRSRDVGAHFGLTPKKYQSGETDVTGGISKVGDAMVRAALYEAANVMLTRAGWFSTLKRWALEVAQRRGMRRAKVALARKLATVLHRLWVDGSEFRFGKQAAAARCDRLTEGGSFGAGSHGPAPLRSRRRDAGTGKAAYRGCSSSDDHATLDWPAGSSLMAWCGGLGVDHGRKHEPGGRMVTRGA